MLCIGCKMLWLYHNAITLCVCWVDTERLNLRYLSKNGKENKSISSSQEGKIVEFWKGTMGTKRKEAKYDMDGGGKTTIEPKGECGEQISCHEWGARESSCLEEKQNHPEHRGIQIFRRKKSGSAQKAPERAYQRLKEGNMTPAVVVDHRKNSCVAKRNKNEKNCIAIVCLNTSCKVLTTIIAKYMTPHTVTNYIWYEGQLGAVECVLGRADPLIIETCILEEMEQLHRNLVLFYDYKKRCMGWHRNSNTSNTAKRSTNK